MRGFETKDSTTRNFVKRLGSRTTHCHLTKKNQDLRIKHDVSFTGGSALVVENNGYVHRIHYRTEPFSNVIFRYPEGQTPHVYNMGGASAAKTSAAAPVTHTAAASAESTAAAHGAAAKAFAATPEAAASTTEAAASIAEANIVTVVAEAAATTAAAITSIISKA
jgi:hypothetical protein